MSPKTPTNGVVKPTLEDAWFRHMAKLRSAYGVHLNCSNDARQLAQNSSYHSTVKCWSSDFWFRCLIRLVQSHSCTVKRGDNHEVLFCLWPFDSRADDWLDGRPRTIPADWTLVPHSPEWCVFYACLIYIDSLMGTSSNKCPTTIIAGNLSWTFIGTRPQGSTLQRL